MNHTHTFKEFHSIQRESRVLAFIGLLIAIPASLLLTLIGASFLEGMFQSYTLAIIIGLVGIALLAISIRGAWKLTTAPRHHIFSMDEETLQHGYLGREKTIPIADTLRIYWDDTEDLTLTITRKDGTKVRLPYISLAVPHKRRPQLLAYLRTAHPDIPLTGLFSPSATKESSHLTNL